MGTDREIVIDATPYLVQEQDGDLRIGRRNQSGEVTWLPETVPADRVDLDDETALAGVVRGIADRGA